MSDDAPESPSVSARASWRYHQTTGPPHPKPQSVLPRRRRSTRTTISYHAALPASIASAVRARSAGFSFEQANCAGHSFPETHQLPTVPSREALRQQGLHLGMEPTWLPLTPEVSSPVTRASFYSQPAAITSLPDVSATTDASAPGGFNYLHPRYITSEFDSESATEPLTPVDSHESSRIYEAEIRRLIRHIEELKVAHEASATPLPDEDSKTIQQTDQVVAAKKHHCIVHGHLFHKIRLADIDVVAPEQPAALPKTNSLKNLQAALENCAQTPAPTSPVLEDSSSGWILDTISKRRDSVLDPSPEELTLPCAICRREENVIWRCDIPVCKVEVCYWCKKRLQKEHRERAVRAWASGEK